MDIAAKFGKQVKKVRLSKNLSQGGLAKRLGVGPAYISKIERGIQNVSLRGLEKLAKALGVASHTLLR